MQRYCQKFIRSDLDKKMVFVGGPRQVGKTTLAKLLGKEFPSFEYLNWDAGEDRQAILQNRWPTTANLVIFDELHKYQDVGGVSVLIELYGKISVI